MPTLFKDSQNADYQYTNWLNLFVNMVAPKNFVGVLGRGTGKTTDILSDRFIDVMYDMPRAYSFFASDTYAHALSDMIPTLLDGLEKKGIRDGWDYVADKKPPSSFETPYKKPLSYKHTISFRNGFFMKTVSMDQPSSMAGASYQHGFGDEVKYIDFEVIKKLFPAIRGEYLTFSKSPFYRGVSFTTDMPNITNKKEFDWFLDKANEMNKDQIKLIISASIALNDIRIAYSRAYDKQNKQQMIILQKRMNAWEERWRKLRMNSTLFVSASSFVNSDLLGVQYFLDSLKSLGDIEFKSSILSFKAEINKGEMFYVNLGTHHRYDDGTRDGYYDQFNMQDKFVASSEELRYIKPNQAIEAGVDFGNMCSMVTGQTQGNYIYAMKELYTLAPEHTRELGQKFREYYRNHPYKQLDMYYDRAGNQNKNIQKDFASDLKKHIEYDEVGNKVWNVTLKNLNQRVIFQDEEYNFMRILLGETDKKLPKVKIDRFKCKCLLSSLSLAKVKVGKNSKGQSTIQKDKSSEKLKLSQLPEYSTNFSDAFKYWLSRTEWMKIAGSRSESSFGDITIS